MTAGHRHRVVHVKRDGLVRWLLQRPTLAVVGTAKADRSRLAWGPTDDPNRWRLSPLGLLHGLTGLTIEHD